MKKSTSYFGNRFSTALRGLRSRRRSSQISVVPAAPVAAPAEFEALEARILLSGLTDGTRVLKNFTFTDADGDRVSIKVTGQLARGAGFQVTDLGNGFDVDEINLVGLTTKNSLAITVTPVRQGAASQTNTGGSLFSPGYTNIGSIVSDVQTNNKGAATAESLGLRNLGINAAIVADINLPTTDILGSISLSTGKTAWIDRLNTTSAATGGQNADGYNPVAGLIDLYDVTAKSIGRITVNGIISSPTNSPFNDNTNDLVGNITVANNLGGITGLRSELSGNVNVGGNMGPIRVGDFTGSLNVGGNLTITVSAEFTGSVVAGGHINLGFKGTNDGVANGNIIAGAGISGLLPSLVDPILVAQGFNGQLINTSTAITAGSGIADMVAGTNAAFTVTSGNSVGDITAVSFGAAEGAPGPAGMVVSSGLGGIGDVRANAGSVVGDFTSGGNIGNLNALGGSVDGTFIAVGSIGDITASTPLGAGITGDFTAGTSIGNIFATISTPTAGSAIDANFDAGTTIATITAKSLATGFDTVTGQINAGDGIGAISITSASSTSALSATIDGDSNNNGIGTIAAITVNSSGTGFGITSGVTTVTAAAIGNISVTMTNAESSAAISGTTFTALAKVENGTGTGIFNNKGSIANIIVVSASAIASGIEDTTFNAGGAGSIGNISVTTAGTGAALRNVEFFADQGPADTEELQTSTIGTLTVVNTGAGNNGTTGFGLYGVSLQANDGVGAISVTTVGSGIDVLTINADVDADGIGNVGAITVTTSAVGSFGWSSGNVSGASVGNIALNINSDQGGFGMTNVNALATAGNIGTVSVTNNSDENNAEGIIISNFTADGIYDEISKTTTQGNIGAVTVTVGAEGNGIKGSNFNANGDIGAINVTAGDDGIESFGDFYSNFNAGGSIASITVTAGDDGIHEYSSFSAAKGIGAIIVTAGEDGIEDSSFTSAEGDIASLTVVAGTAGKDFADGIYQSNFTAANIGAISVAVDAVNELEDPDDVTARGIYSSTFTATGVSDLVNKVTIGGTIGTVSVTATAISTDEVNPIDTTATGIEYYSSFTAVASIGNITVSASAASKNGDADAIGLSFSDFTSTGDLASIVKTGGTIGTVTIEANANSENEDATARGANHYNGTILSANEIIGAVTITADSTVTTGSGLALSSGAFGVFLEAGTTMSEVTVGATSTADAALGVAYAYGVEFSKLEAGTAITSVDVTAVATANNTFAGGVSNSQLNSDGTVGNITVGSRFVVSSVSAVTSIGNLNVSGNINGVDLTVGKGGTIGNVIGSGTGGQNVTANGGAGSEINNISFTSLADGSLATVTLTGIETAGNITVDAAESKNMADLTLVATTLETVGNITVGGDASINASALVTVGNIDIDGELTLVGDLSAAEAIGNFTIGSFAAPGAQTLIGAGDGKTNTEIGFITIGQDLASADQYVFEFDSFDGVTDQDDDTVFAEVDGDDYAFDGTNPLDTTDGGIRFNLV